MNILTYVELTSAQERALDDIGQKVTVRTALATPYVVATFSTFQSQELKITIDPAGVMLKADIIQCKSYT